MFNNVDPNLTQFSHGVERRSPSLSNMETSSKLTPRTYPVMELPSTTPLFVLQHANKEYEDASPVWLI
ncbi:hypothetical protein J1614_011738 [Plenodomus biglobosus]|nr:hypothetical protein J1614_011738 [Plenodomus biglobosus]